MVIKTEVENLTVDTTGSEFKRLFTKVYCLRYEWPDVFDWLRAYEDYQDFFRLIEEGRDNRIGSEEWKQKRDRHLRDPLYGGDGRRVYSDRKLLGFLYNPPFFSELEREHKAGNPEDVLRMCIYWTGITGTESDRAPSRQQTNIAVSTVPLTVPLTVPSASSQRLEYENFDIAIERTRDTEPWRLNATGPTGETTAERDEIDDKYFNQSVWGNILRPEVGDDNLRSFGEELFSILFSGTVEELFRSSLGQCRASGKALRIHLRLGTSELNNIPWEYLYDRSERQYLALSPEVPISRYLSVASYVRDLRIKPPIKVLFFASRPRDAGRLNHSAELGMIRDALANLVATGTVQLHVVEIGTLANFRQSLREGYHIVHFSGHGSSVEGRLGLVFEDEASGSRFVSEDALKEVFVGNRTVRLLHLSACGGTDDQRVKTDEAIRGIAPKLVRGGIPAVLVMQSAIDDIAAMIFSREFYQALATNFAIDVAVAEARRAIFLDFKGRHEWAIPTLYLQARDGRIFDIDEAHRRPIELSHSLGSEARTADGVNETQDPIVDR